MRKSKFTLLVVSSFLLCTFLIIGYASISSDLFIYGTLDVTPQVKKIYISDVKVISTSGINSVAYEYIYPTNLSSTVNALQTNGTITYEVIVYNNTDVTYWYHGIKLTSNYEANSLVGITDGITITTKDKLTDNALTFNTDDWIPPHTYRTFYVTYKYGDNALGYLSTFINFHFDVRMDVVHDSFLNILNDTTSKYEYNYLKEVFDTKYAEDGSTIIGNIGKDKEIFDNLFGEDLMVEIDGVKKPVTVMIKKSNVDNLATGEGIKNGPAGCEYTLYITSDNLANSGSQAVVYAISYTIDENGQVWYQLAELYEGKANIEDYDDSDNVYEGAFNIDSWLATQKDYTVAEGLIYKVGYEQGDQYDKLKKLEDLMSTVDQDIFNDIDNTKIMKTIYDILNENKYSTADEIVLLQKEFSNATPYFTNFNNGQEFKVIRNYTRAQIIPVIEKLQKSLDYYHQIRG